MNNSYNMKWFNSPLQIKVLLGCFFIILFYACSKKTEKPKLFTLISSEYSRIHFNNQIQPFENDTLNALEYDVLFNGAGGGINDFNSDGDLDLFRGSRVFVSEYPTTPDSYLLRNDNGVFKDVTAELSEGLQKSGMVSSALWTDYNQDGWYDLVVVGEFMPISFYKNQKGKLIKDVNATLPNSSGWWNSITADDFDQDGDIDYIIGNLGLNSQYKTSINKPLKVYGSDFVGNGVLGSIITYIKE